MRLSTEKNKKKLLTVRVGLFSLREKAPTKNGEKYMICNESNPEYKIFNPPFKHYPKCFAYFGVDWLLYIHIWGVYQQLLLLVPVNCKSRNSILNVTEETYNSKHLENLSRF